MLIPDVNLLVYAYNSDAPFHQESKLWWESCLNGTERVGMPWVTLLGFLRLTTSRAILLRPFDPSEGLGFIRSWLLRPQVQLIEPGPQHLAILEELATSLGVAGRLTTDLHLAALAIERNARICSNDADFARMSGLRLENPLASA
ncbi:MAG TPA: TA system VapC family ribonuclease toxin [Thermoanaerobaculia bacterium]